MIQSDAFREALIDLDLFESDPEVKDHPAEPETSHKLPMKEQLDLCKHVCQPPPSEKNDLAGNVGKLLGTETLSEDMTVTVHDDQGATEELVCHRVVLCARVPYFRRALQSGMKESIER